MKQNKFNHDLIIEKFKEVNSLKETAKYIGCSISLVSNVLKKNNIYCSYLKKHKLNEYFFDEIDTEAKAYWFGFLCADGSVSSTYQRYSLTLGLSIKDLDHLKAFKNALECTNNISIYTIKHGIGCGKQYCRIKVESKRLITSLISKGCTPRKSLTLKFPDESVFKYKDLIHHFIRGYFDGDGSVFISNEKH